MSWLLTPHQGALSNALFVSVLLLPHASAVDAALQRNSSPEAAAFARYIGWVHERDPFTEAGPSLIFVRASLPNLYKDAEMLAIRQPGENERSVYQIISGGGDGTVAGEVMARYFELEKKVADLPLSSILITPNNYKFHYRGALNTGGQKVYIYSIVPKKNRFGMIKGQLWIDGATGAEVLLSGRFTGPNGGIDLVRETDLNNGRSVIRTTHLSCTLPLVGRGELEISETPLRIASDSDIPKRFPRDSVTLLPRME